MHNFREAAVARGDAPAESLKYGDQEFVMAQMGEEEIDERNIEWEGTTADAEPQLKKNVKNVVEREPSFTLRQYVDIGLSHWVSIC